MRYEITIENTAEVFGCSSHQHLLQGRDSSDVIDELEAIFEQQYRQLRGDRG